MLKILKNFFSNRTNIIGNSEISDGKTNVLNSINSLFASLESPVVLIKTGSDIAEKSDCVINTIDKIRKKIYYSSGFIFPPVRCVEDLDLQENEIIFFINNSEKAHKFLIPNKDNIEKEILSSMENLYNINVADIFSNEIVEEYINIAANKNPRLISDITFALSTLEIKQILVFLLLNGKSIKNISLIFEKISECFFIDKLQDFKRISIAMLNKV